MKPMREVFELPVVVLEAESTDVCCDTDYMLSDSTDTTCGEMYSRPEAQHAAHAINSHDLLTEALSDILRLMKRKDESSMDYFERIAEWHYKETGILRPGKDSVIHSPEEQEKSYNEWVQSIKDGASDALKQAQGE